jgi:chromosome segregation ATPase
MGLDATSSGTGIAGLLAGAGQRLAETGGGAREAVNLRLLLELRRRLKAAAEKELSAGSQRVRALREEVREAEAELRLCFRMLNARADQLAQASTAVAGAQERASQTCVRLGSLAQENDDLDQQLKEAKQGASRLQLSVRAENHTSHSALESFVLATAGLVRELSQASRDQSFIRARTQDLMAESGSLASRAGSLRDCFRRVHEAMTDICEHINQGLVGGSTGRAERPRTEPAEGGGNGADRPAADDPVSISAGR